MIFLLKGDVLGWNQHNYMDVSDNFPPKSSICS